MEYIYGDCLEEMPKIKSQSVDMVLADPPYGTTACKWDSVISLELMWKELKRIIKPGGTIAMTASQPFTTSLICSNIKMFKYCWVWEKNRATNFPNAKRRPLTAHEDIVIFMEGKLKYFPQKTKGHIPTNSAKRASQGTIYHGDNIRNYEGGETERFPRTVIKFNCERGFHPTQKPVALMEYLIKTYTNENETVLDFTCGSGTTGVACRNTNRHCILIDNGECEKTGHYFGMKWVDIAKNRIEQKQPITKRRKKRRRI